MFVLKTVYEKFCENVIHALGITKSEEFRDVIFITKSRPCNIQRFFHGCKNDNFQLIFFFNSFHIFAQNIYCGYTLEPPHRGGSKEYPQYMF